MARLLKLQARLIQISLALTIYRIGSGLIGVFIPLVILKTGATLTSVAWFYMAYALLKLGLNYPIVRLAQRRGPHFTLGLGFLASITQAGAVIGYAHTDRFALLLMASLALAITNACLWNSQHIFISRLMDDRSKSSSIATLEIIGQVADVITPFAGGVIGATLGPLWLLIVASVVTLTAFWPLRAIRYVSTTTATSREPFTYNLRGAPLRDIAANFCFNIDAMVGTVIWPIYLAVTIKTYQGIGGILSLAAFVTVIAVYVAGRQGDRGGDRTVLKRGAFISSLVHLARILAATPLTITLVSATYRSSLAYLQNAWTSTYYHHAKNRGIHYIMSMEIACDVALVALWGVLLLALQYGSPTIFFDTAFVIAAVASYGCLMISNQQKPVSRDR